jgi:hypothetical protein
MITTTCLILSRASSNAWGGGVTEAVAAGVDEGAAADMQAAVSQRVATQAAGLENRGTGTRWTLAALGLT